ncbi:MAG: sulfatase, partial [Planctomycetes bacterium]|nr:sulfatase [Planctomycetota bacterium]
MKHFMRCATLFGAVLVSATHEAGEVAHATVRPNIVILLADQWRASATGYAGDPNVKTPNLDRLAEQSLNFAN